ncbi:MAG: type 4a pilus biogenesis protein PilO [Acidobacteria bacterium]|nr:type 4a pilus biogenesis protein PilO [Acidobacteriota bacterium]
MDFKKLPFWGQFGAIAGMAFALVAVAWWAYPNFGEMAKKNEADESRLEGLQTEIRKGQAIEAKLPEFEREIENLQAKLSDLLAILPTEPETGELLKWVKNLADQSNLDLKQFNPGALRPVEFYKEFPITMEVNGDYHDLGVFFDRISKYSRIINVSGVNVGANRSGRGSITSMFTATTFVYDDSGGAQ